MVLSSCGYLVVNRLVGHVDTRNRRYRGLYRTPEWSQPAFESGFNDPLVFGRYTDELGLIRTLEDAQNVLKQFGEIHLPHSMEIIWTCQVDRGAFQPSNRFCRIGIDVASKAPFWSILADMPNDVLVDEISKTLNANGLFDSLHDAASYLAAYRLVHPETRDVVLYLWDVYTVRDSSSPK